MVATVNSDWGAAGDFTVSPTFPLATVSDCSGGGGAALNRQFMCSRGAIGGVGEKRSFVVVTVAAGDF